MRATKPLLHRLIDQLDINPSGCWLFKGYLIPNGYGLIQTLIDGEWKKRGAHVVAYELWKGDIPPNKSVLHHCDVKNCCNPTHIYLGTAAQNMQDAINRGKWEHHGWSSASRQKLSNTKRGKLKT